MPISEDRAPAEGPLPPALGLEPWVPAIRIERIPEVSHWVQAEAPDRVNALLGGFLSAA